MSPNRLFNIKKCQVVKLLPRKVRQNICGFEPSLSYIARHPPPPADVSGSVGRGVAYLGGKMD